MSSLSTTFLSTSELSAAKRALLDARLRGHSRASDVIRRAQRSQAPLSFAQERLWFLERLQPASAVYNVPTALRLQGALNVAALERALGEVMRRHESLRTSFAEVDGAPVQVIAPFRDFILPVEQVSPTADPEAEVRRLALEEAAWPFDLATGPLVRVRLLRLHEAEHVLFLTLHHIVSDGWSMGVLFRELSALYGAYGDGRESPLPDLPVQYADYAAWQREHLQGEPLAQQLTYWKARLAGAPALLSLPTDHPRPAVQSQRGASVRLEVPLPIVERLRELVRNEGSTLYMVLLAGFQVLLAKYSGSPDVVVGSPIAGRTRKEVEGLMGFFVNTLALRADLSGNPTFREVLRRVRDVTLGAFDHQDVPFEKLVSELQVERSLSHAPLVQVLFALQSAAGSRAGLPGLVVRGVDAEIDRTQFDLALQLTEAPTPQGLVGAVTFSTDLFERRTIRRLANHFRRVLEQVAANPDVRLVALELMPLDERAQVVGEWNQTELPFPAGRAVHELVEEWAHARPMAVAVVADDNSLSYGALNARANRLARRLQHLGVGPESRVALYLPRSIDMVVAMLAVLKTGAAYVPLDAGTPADRVAFTLADAHATALVTQDSLGDRIPMREGLAVVNVDAEHEAIAREPAGNLERNAGPRSLAYVIYTSGSTGRPKGVAVEHRGLSSLCRWHAHAFGTTAADRATQLASPGFDAAAWEIWPYLTYGACIHIVPEDVRADPGALRDWLVRRAITVAFVPTPLAEPLTALEWPRTTALRWLLTGGDWLKGHGGAAVPFALSNNYGPTECTVVATSGVVEREGTGAPPIGKPISNARAYVLDGGLGLAPAGVPGELYLGGAGVARGYLDRPALTAERFIPDPFAREPGARLYRSGDRVRWRSEGTIEFLGRVDRQVKLRGFRIEPGEIEAAIATYPGVRDARVIAREDAPGAARLVAFVVGAADADDLRAHLRRTSPEYMVPAAFVPLEAVPLTPNGKLDVAALPMPDLRVLAAPMLDRPMNHVEVELIHIWEELLGVEVPSPHVSFFDLGGNSLLGVRLLAQVKDRLRCDLPVATLFAGSTIREMAAAILEQQPSHDPSSPIVPLQPNGSRPALFCVHPSDRGVGVYFNLARHLGRDQPVFGLRDVGEDPSRPIHQVASEHVRALRSFQPDGPYQLLGYSYGGMVVYEMAVQLERQGELVAFLGVIDAPEPLVARVAMHPDDTTIVAARAVEIAVNMGRPFSLRPEELDGLSEGDQYRHAVEALHAQGAAPRFLDAAMLRDDCETMRGRETSVERYVPTGSFSGTLTVFRASSVSDALQEILAPLTDEEKRTLGWCRVLPRPIEVHWIPGTHYTMRMEPHVRVLAERMRESLAAARVAAAPEDVLQAPTEPHVLHGQLSTNGC